MTSPSQQNRPALLPCQPDQIPTALREARRWAPWAGIWDAQRGKYDKVPRQAANPEYGLSTVRPERWAAFDAATAAYAQDFMGALAGLGYCMTGPHGVVGIDLDRCLQADGTPEPWAAEIVDQMASYTEVSPSGNGLRIFVLGAIDADWTNPDQGLEVYGGHEPRFLTVTGQRLAGAPAEVRPADPAALQALAARYAKERRRAEVIDLNIPDVLDDLVLPNVASLPLPEKVERFLLAGEADGDRSGVLHAAGVALYSAGLDDAMVLSLLATNGYAMGVALDHRRQDYDRAMLYLWREHCVKARPKASTPASPDEFEVVDAPPRGTADALAALGLRRKVGKGQWAGWFLATAENLMAALRLAHVAGFEVRFDVFRDEIMRRAPGGDWQPFKDADYTRLKLALEGARIEPIPFELLRACVRLIADEQTFDSAQDVITRLQWDGVPRVETFYHHYLKAADTPYTRACGLYTWTAMAGRVLTPGCKADMVPILVGAQGLRKSSTVEAMALSPEWHGALSLSGKDADLSRQMRGKAVIELPELRGLRTRELESIKAFITEGSNAWVAKYQEFETKYPRRCLFIGTTNEEEFLDDDTGNRRWLPLKVGLADTEALRADQEQLWAEGVARFRKGGVQYERAEALAEAEHAAYAVTDEWEDPIRSFLQTEDALTGERPADRGFITSSQIFANALFITVERTDTRASKRLARAMRALGWVKDDTRKNKEGRGWRFGTREGHV